MSKPYKSIRIFKSDFLEKFTHIHPLSPAITWVPIIAWLYWRSVSVQHLGLLAILNLSVFGFISWTFSEYMLHRFIFHFHPVGAFQERIRFLLHGIHHDDPIDPTRLVLPPFLSLTLGYLLYLGWNSLLGPHLIEPFFAAYVIGYLGYDYIHFALHHFTPRTEWGKQMKHYHMLHHFVTPEARWGVSSPLWDYIFGTMKERGEKVRHGT